MNKRRYRGKNKNTPLVTKGRVFIGEDAIGYKIGSPQWQELIEDGQTFYFKYKDKSFTARAEERYKGVFWYAYKSHNGRVSKRYLGKAEALNITRLKRAAERLP